MTISMVKLRAYRHAAIVLASVLILDLGVRFIVGFEMSRVVAFEAVLFAIAGALLLWEARRSDGKISGVRRLDFWLAAFFALGSLRAGLWAAGVEVYVANLVIFAVAAFLGGGLLLRRWKRRRDDALAA